MTSTDLMNRIVELGLDKKGQQIVTMNIAELTGIGDYFVIISGNSDVHVKAIADHIEKELKDEDVAVYHKEGYQHLTWVLLDYIDVVVHIFQRDAREYYAIERLWADAPIKFITEQEA